LTRKNTHISDGTLGALFHNWLWNTPAVSGTLGAVKNRRCGIFKSDQNTISVKIGEGMSQRHIAYDPKLRSNVSVFESQERAIAVGDRIQFTTPWKEKGVASRDTAAVEQLETNGNIAVRLENGRRVAWNLRDYNHIDYAYAMTSHSSQGMTVDRVLVHVDTTDSRVRGLVDKALSYVATSRARYDARIFTDNGLQLNRALSRDNARDIALSEKQIQEHAAQYAHV
jgi:ATP-dependent exoDNAse (exonuclease V) alpha subunit